MPSLRDHGGKLDGRDDKRGLRLGCGAVLAATSALAWTTLLRPDLVPSGLPTNGSASLVVGLASLAALGLVAGTGRPVSATVVETAESVEDESPRSEPPPRGVASMRAGVAELTQAAAAARIRRVLVLVPPGAKAQEAVNLARRMAEANDPTVLVDLDEGRTGGDLALARDVESIAHIAASPTSFANAIQRDRGGRTHVLMARLDAPQASADAASVLATLEEVYARVVAIVPADAALVAAFVHADTALVVPRSAENDPAVAAAVARLASSGFEEVIVLDGELERRSNVVPHEAALKRVARR